jgi:hypothetical protein
MLNILLVITILHINDYINNSVGDKKGIHYKLKNNNISDKGKFIRQNKP